jgi:hypothetical protein
MDSRFRGNDDHRWFHTTITTESAPQWLQSVAPVRSTFPHDTHVRTPSGWVGYRRFRRRRFRRSAMMRRPIATNTMTAMIMYIRAFLEEEIVAGKTMPEASRLVSRPCVQGKLQSESLVIRHQTSVTVRF